MQRRNCEPKRYVVMVNGKKYAEMENFIIFTLHLI
jgi:hypothetical protein